MNDKQQTIDKFVKQRNSEKLLFTAGPASLMSENITGLRPCFGRGDQDYAEVETLVLDGLKRFTGHQHIVRMQGSASLALEIMALNFLYGRVLVISTGYYSDRLHWLANSSQRRMRQVKDVVQIDWQEISSVEGRFDWVVACYTETSCGLKLPIELLRSTADKLNARLMVDATASIGLEERHDLADVMAFSSCKGLFGLTGASFVTFHQPPSVEVDSFYLSLETHINRLMTGPYHSICSLADVLPRHDEFRSAVQYNKDVFLKRFGAHLTLPDHHQPMLCTHINCKINSRDPRAILYEPRSNKGGSVICHLGEVQLGKDAHGEILDVLQVIA